MQRAGEGAACTGLALRGERTWHGVCHERGELLRAGVAVGSGGRVCLGGSGPQSLMAPGPQGLRPHDTDVPDHRLPRGMWIARPPPAPPGPLPPWIAGGCGNGKTRNLSFRPRPHPPPPPPTGDPYTRGFTRGSKGCGCTAGGFSPPLVGVSHPLRRRAKLENRVLAPPTPPPRHSQGCQAWVTNVLPRMGNKCVTPRG